ncbi:MAG: SDR family oxidoreductase [Deltaproteobacteria bacterium]|nr:SDR family oxidoreductase [Deltaproteobacteria bacterium]
MDTERLQGKVVLVTGAASGIGRATALRFAAEGARVFCSDVQFEACEATAKSIREAGGEAIAIACNVTRSEECDAAVSAVVEQAGALDVLANIAGIGIYRHATDYSDDEWRRVIEVNLNGSFFMCRAAIPRLLESKGSIINMASAAGLSATPYGAAYSASEYGRQGLRANCVCPGGVDTPLTRSFNVPGGVDPALMARLNFLPMLGQPDDIAALVAYLASDEARYVNGAAISIDGGQTC